MGGCGLLSEMRVLIHLPRFLLALFFFTATGRAVGVDAAPFFERNCLDCHETGTTKGGLNLEKVDPAMSGPEQADLWTSIYDRVAKGEMPPAKRERPPKAEVDQLLAAIRPRLIESDRSPAPSEPFRI